MDIVTHNGKTPPVLKNFFDPDSQQWVWFNYPTSKTIVTSEWELASGISQVQVKQAETVTDPETSTAYPNSNAVLIAFNGIANGQYLITNRVTFADGSKDDKSCYLIVRQT